MRTFVCAGSRWVWSVRQIPSLGGKEVSAMDITEIIIYMITFIVLLIIVKDSRPSK